MADSQPAAVSGETPVTVPTTDSSSTENEATAAPDLSAELADIQNAAERGAIEGELKNLRRQAGHVPGLQAKVAELEKRVKAAPAGGFDADRWNGLLDALVSEAGLPTSVSEKFRINTTVDPRVAALEERLAELEPPAPSDSPEEVSAKIAALEKGWTRSEALARERGTKLGLSAEEMPPLAEWTAIFNEDPESPTDGFAKIMAKIEAAAAAKARRTERADAADGGASGTQAVRKGGLTWEAASKMSREELATYTVEERDAAMAAGRR